MIQERKTDYVPLQQKGLGTNIRLNQVSIRIERFGESAPDGKRQLIKVYADANSTYEALAAAFFEALDALQAYQRLPAFGRRSSSEEGVKFSSEWDGSDRHLREEIEKRRNGSGQ